MVLSPFCWSEDYSLAVSVLVIELAPYWTGSEWRHGGLRNAVQEPAVPWQHITDGG